MATMVLMRSMGRNLTALSFWPSETAFMTVSISLARSAGRPLVTSNRRTRWLARVSLSNIEISSMVRLMLRLLSRISRRLAGS